MRMALRSIGRVALATAFGASAASAASISATVTADNGSCVQGATFASSGGNSTCSQNGSGTADDWGAQWTAQGGTSAALAGTGSTSVGFTIDAAVAADDAGAEVGEGPDRWLRADIRYTVDLAIDVDSAQSEWNVDLFQSALALLALQGDGAGTAVGTQDPGSLLFSAITLRIDGKAAVFNPALPSAGLGGNPSNTETATREISGSRTDLGIVSGTGDANFEFTVIFNLQAFSNDGCTGAGCSSASGGEEAAVLFGLENVIDQSVDDYATWGRAIGPDGYGALWTLNVTAIPEPGTLGLLALGLVGLAVARRR